MDTLYGIDPTKMVELNRTAIPSTSSTHVVLDVAEMMRAYAEGMQRAFQMGWEARMHDVWLASCPPAETEVVTEDQVYWGVYDDVSYGVYQDRKKLETSERFWHRDHLCWQTFPSYEEALQYARKGIADIKVVSVDMIPPMQYSIDWRQMV